MDPAADLRPSPPRHAATPADLYVLPTPRSGPTRQFCVSPTPAAVTAVAGSQILSRGGLSSSQTLSRSGPRWEQPAVTSSSTRTLSRAGHLRLPTADAALAPLSPGAQYRMSTSPAEHYLSPTAVSPAAEHYLTPSRVSPPAEHYLTPLLPTQLGTDSDSESGSQSGSGSGSESGSESDSESGSESDAFQRRPTAAVSDILFCFWLLAAHLAVFAEPIILFR